MRCHPWIVGAAASIALSACGGSPGKQAQVGTSAPTTAVADRAHGFRLTYPRSWHRAGTSLTPSLADPREVISIGTGRLPPGGPCAQFPGRAVSAVSPDGAFVSIQIRSQDHGTPQTPVRTPLTFRSGTALERIKCGATANRPQGRWISFHNTGRVVYALLVVGRHASAATRRQALAALNSLRISPAA